MIRTGNQGGDVRGHPGRRFEGPGGGVLAGGFGCGRWGVAHHLPVRRGGDRQLERRLQVGLFEARIHTPRIGGFELCVEVCLVIDRIDEAVEAFARVHVAALRLDRDGVVLRESGQVDASTLDHGAGIEFGAVQGHRLDALADQVDPGV